MRTVRIALCQVNPTVGDLRGNTELIRRCIGDASPLCPDIIAFPELAITGYPPEDLLLRPQFIDDNLEALDEVRQMVGDATVVVGFVDRKDDIFNAAAVIRSGKIVDVYHKVHLPNYGVFDEFRYFQTGTRYPVYDMNGVLFGVNICEDIWYPDGPTVVQALAGAELIININASPFHIAKSDFRRKMLSTRASENSVAVAYLNTVGGQDELVFDGHSFVIDQGGEIIAEGRAFEEDLIVVDIDLDAVLMKRLHDPRRRKQVLSQQGCLTERVSLPGPFAQGAFSRPPCPRRVPVKMEQLPGGPEEVYRALVLGTGDYVRKNRFTGVCIGLSGGIDSSIVAAVAVDAIGHEHVTGIFMPSPYTSVESREDVRDLAGALGIRVIEVPIDDIFKQFLATLGPWFSGLPVDTTEENIQARIRGNILMAFSNKFGWLVLTTGNKSEMSVGYATLYGDMAGGFAVIKDVPKTLVYDLCRWRNDAAGRAIIPERVLVKAPTAELKPDQRDTDTLPPYDVLDPILRDYIEKDMSHDEIVRAAAPGCGEKAVRRVLRMVDNSEYKRRQSPPGVKITPRAFGKDRRFPITNRYEG